MAVGAAALGPRPVSLSVDDTVRGLDDEVKRTAMGLHQVRTEDELVESVLDGIHVAEAFNSNHQMLFPEKAEELVKDNQDSSGPSGWSASTR